MKRKILHPTLIAACLAVVIGLSATVLVTSCQKESIVPEPELSKGVQPQADWAYLDFTADYAGVIESPCDSNAMIITEAINRMNNKQQDGWWEITATSPEQVKMSARLFEYVRQVAERSNAILQETLKNAASVPHTRMLGELPIDDMLQPNDCVACCVDRLSQFLKYPDVNYARANSYVSSTYGDGVPQNKVLPTLQYFYGRNNVSSISKGSLRNVDMSQSGVMITYSTGGGNGHAVVYISTAEDGSYNVYDAQQNRVDQIAPGSVTGIYHVLKNN